LQDEIHYYTSCCVLNRGIAARIKGDALEALIHIYASNFDQHSSSMLMSSVGSVMDVLCTLMVHETDNELILKALMLLMALCSNHEGSFIEAIILPDSITDYLLIGRITESLSVATRQDDCCEMEMNGKQLENKAIANIAPKYHRKRKYITTKTLFSESSHAIEREKSDHKTVQAVIDPDHPREHIISTGLSSCRLHFSTLYEAFWRCSSCTGANNNSNDDHLIAEIQRLRLLLLNRYIATKIQCLTSIQTSYFSSGRVDSCSEIASEPRGKKVVDFYRGSGEGSAAPILQEVTTHSAYYRRQSDCLAALQLKMSTVDLQRPGSQTYLQSLSHHLQETCDVMRCLPPDHGSSCPCLSRSCRGGVWLIMGVLEGACFRCPSNQLLIANFGLSQGAANSLDPSCIGLLTSILVSCTPPCASERTVSEHRRSVVATIDQTAIVHPRDIAPFKAELSDNQRETTRRSPPQPDPPRLSGPSTGIIRERDRIALQVKRAANLFTELLVQSADPSTDKDCVPPINFNAPDEATPLINLQIMIGVQDVQIAALKALISITNNCEGACSAALLEADLAQWCVAMLAWCAAWRCVLSSDSECISSAGPLGALTPNETPFEVQSPAK